MRTYRIPYGVDPDELPDAQDLAEIEYEAREAREAARAIPAQRKASDD